MYYSVLCSKPCLQFQWQLEGIPFDRSICSGRLPFHNETYNFVCKLQYGTLLTLSVVESPFGPYWTDITDIVCTADEVTCFVMERDNQSKGLWKYCFDVNVDRTCTLHFRVHLTETVVDYKYQLVNSLLSVHLWEAAKNKFMTDIEFFVEGKCITAHRAVLDARCPVLLKVNPQEVFSIENGVSADTLSSLLHFIYTGQLDKIPDYQLWQLAEKCKLSTLLSLCSIACEDDDQNDLKPRFTFGSKSGKIVRSLTGLTLQCTINFTSSCHQSHDFEFNGQLLFNITTTSNTVILHSNFCGDLKVSEVFFRRELGGSLRRLHSVLGSNGIQEFVGYVDTSKQNCHPTEHFPIYVEVYVLPNMPKFEFKLTDIHLTDDLWMSTRKGNRGFTDLKLVIEDRTFLVHRAILAARSAYFANMFMSGMVESLSGQVVIPDAPALVFENLLYFLYTGSVQPSTDFEELLIIADKYQIDSLISLCKAKIGL